MASYVQQQSVGDIIRNTFAIYGKGFGVIFLVYFLPVAPVTIWVNEAALAQAWGLWALGYVVSIIVTLFASAAITVSVSDICLGNRPSIARSYKKVLRSGILKLLGTNLMQVAIVLVGFVLLIIPGIIALFWLMFTPSAVVLEGVGGFAALKRSKALADGYNWRNFGVFLLLLLILVVVGAILGGLFALILPQAASRFPERIFQAILNMIGATVTLTMIVLLYYDLRVRKEAYDAAALAEDLRR
jgi:hypothetical protein